MNDLSQTCYWWSKEISYSIHHHLYPESSGEVLQSYELDGERCQQHIKTTAVETQNYSIGDSTRIRHSQHGAKQRGYSSDAERSNVENEIIYTVIVARYASDHTTYDTRHPRNAQHQHALSLARPFAHHECG